MNPNLMYKTFPLNRNLFEKGSTRRSGAKLCYCILTYKSHPLNFHRQDLFSMLLTCKHLRVYCYVFKRFQNVIQSCELVTLLLLFNHYVTSYSATPWNAACQAPLSLGLSQQAYWNGLLFPSPGDLLYPGMSYCSAKSDEEGSEMPCFDFGLYLRCSTQRLGIYITYLL